MPGLIVDPLVPERPAEQTQLDAIRGKLYAGTFSVVDAIRAFSVVVGPSVLADAAAATSVGRVAFASRHTPPPRWALAGVGAFASYVALGRPWLRRWGTTAAERTKALPADEMVHGPCLQSTRAVTIDAPVEAVWPWLAQMGQDRAGFYSYEWLENLAGCRIRNADVLHAEWQHRAPREMVPLHPGHGQPVTRFEPPRVLALEGWGAFVLEPLPDGRTRLIARSRVPRGIGSVIYALLIEIPHFVMERKMLLGIKRRAERPSTAIGR